METIYNLRTYLKQKFNNKLLKGSDIEYIRSHISKDSKDKDNIDSILLEHSKKALINNNVNIKQTPSSKSSKPKKKKKKNKIINPAVAFVNRLKTHSTQKRGKFIRYKFRCRLCSCTHVEGYLVNFEGEEYEVCKYCAKQNDFVKILYTPMGRN